MPAVLAQMNSSSWSLKNAFYIV